jgi:hypothetical protein
MTPTELAFEACRLLKRFANGDATTDHGEPSARQEDYHRAVDFAELALKRERTGPFRVVKKQPGATP